MSLPPYICVKCGNRDVNTTWHADGPTCGMASCTHHEVKPERLEHCCRRCQYRWTTGTADKAGF